MWSSLKEACRLPKPMAIFQNTVFCDVFVLQNAKIKHLTAYLMPGQKIRRQG